MSLDREQINFERKNKDIAKFKEKFGNDLYENGLIVFEYSEFETENEFKLYRAVKDIYEQTHQLSKSISELNELLVTIQEKLKRDADTEQR